MNWLTRLLGREPGERERRAREVVALEVKSDATLERIQRLAEERGRVIAATRGAVKALRANHR